MGEMENVAFLALFLPRPETEKVSPLPFSQSVHLLVWSLWHGHSPGGGEGGVGASEGRRVQLQLQGPP